MAGTGSLNYLDVTISIRRNRLRWTLYEKKKFIFIDGKALSESPNFPWYDSKLTEHSKVGVVLVRWFDTPDVLILKQTSSHIYNGPHKKDGQFWLRETESYEKSSEFSPLPSEFRTMVTDPTKDYGYVQLEQAHDPTRRMGVPKRALGFPTWR